MRCDAMIRSMMMLECDTIRYDDTIDDDVGMRYDTIRCDDDGMRCDAMRCDDDDVGMRYDQ